MTPRYFQKGFSFHCNLALALLPSGPFILLQLDREQLQRATTKRRQLSSCKETFLIISKLFHFTLDKSVCLFFVPFYPPFAEEAVRPFSDRKPFFFILNVYDHSLSLLSIEIMFVWNVYWPQFITAKLKCKLKDWKNL